MNHGKGAILSQVSVLVVEHTIKFLQSMTKLNNYLNYVWENGCGRFVMQLSCILLCFKVSVKPKSLLCLFQIGQFILLSSGFFVFSRQGLLSCSEYCFCMCSVFVICSSNRVV